MLRVVLLCFNYKYGVKTWYKLCYCSLNTKTVNTVTMVNSQNIVVVTTPTNTIVKLQLWWEKHGKYVVVSVH